MASYYISTSGSDSNPGTIAAPWKTLSKIATIAAGDFVLLKRGDKFFETFPTIPGSTSAVTVIGPYGVGARPCVSNLRTITGAWANTSGNIWRVAINTTTNYTGNPTIDTNVGFIKVNGVIYGNKVSATTSLLSAWDFYSDATYLYVYSVGSPAGTIQFAPNINLLNTSDGLHLLDIELKGTGAHGIATGLKTGVKIINCKITEIGGSYLSGTTRYGNGIEVYAGGTDIEIKANEICEVWDTATTMQGTPSMNWTNIVISGNRIYNCSQSCEAWCDNATYGFYNCKFINNYCFHAGYGWGYASRPYKLDTAHLLFYQWVTASSDILFENNTFYRAKSGLYWSNQSSLPPVTSKNNNIFLDEGQVISFPGTDAISAYATFVTNTGKEVGSRFFEVDTTVTDLQSTIKQTQALVGALVSQVYSIERQIGEVYADARLSGDTSPNLNAAQTFSNSQTFLAPNASSIPVTIRGVASQSANLLEFRDNTNFLMLRVANNGNLSGNYYYSLSGDNALTFGGSWPNVYTELQTQSVGRFRFFNTGLVIQPAGGTITDAGYGLDLKGAAMRLGVGTATASPLDYTPTGAVLKTSPVAGNSEVDANGISYYTHAASERGVNDAEQFVSLTSNYTLTSQTALQKLFNSTTNGALTVGGSKTYFFECNFDLTGLSATSGTFSFGFLGTATFTSLRYTALGFKAAATAPAMTTGTAAAATVISLASTGTTGNATIKGVLRINAGGTIIPAVGLSVAAAAVVSLNSFFRIWAVGTNTVTNAGNWS